MCNTATDKVCNSASVGAKDNAPFSTMGSRNTISFVLFLQVGLDIANNLILRRNKIPSGNTTLFCETTDTNHQVA